MFSVTSFMSSFKQHDVQFVNLVPFKVKCRVCFGAGALGAQVLHKAASEDHSAKLQTWQSTNQWMMFPHMFSTDSVKNENSVLKSPETGHCLLEHSCEEIRKPKSIHMHCIGKLSTTGQGARERNVVVRVRVRMRMRVTCTLYRAQPPNAIDSCSFRLGTRP